MKIITDDIINVTEKWLDTFVNRVKVEIQNQGLSASGNLSNNLTWEVVRKGNDVHAVVYGVDYFQWAEGGRPKGKTPTNFVDILEEWIADKHLSVPSKFKSARDFAEAIKWKTIKYGSAKHRGSRPKNDVLGRPMDEMLPALNEYVENRVVVYINDKIFDL